MSRIKHIAAVLSLAFCVLAQAQTAANQSAKKSAKAKPRAQEQILLEQLSENLEKLDQLSKGYRELQQQVDTLQKEMAARDAELSEARKDAAEAKAKAADTKQKMDTAQKAVGPDGANIAALQTAVTDLRNTSTSLTTTLETEQQATRKLENPEALHYRGITLKPGGFLAGETVNRQRGTASDVNTPYLFDSFRWPDSRCAL